MTEQTQLVAYANTTDKAQLDSMTQSVIAALTLKNLPEIGESAKLEVGGRTAAAETLGVSSIIYKAGEESIVLPTAEAKNDAPVAKANNLPKFDG